MDSFFRRVKDLSPGFFTGLVGVGELNPAIIDKLGCLLKKPDSWYCFLEQLHHDAPDFGKRYRYLKCLSQKEFFKPDAVRGLSKSARQRVMALHFRFETESLMYFLYQSSRQYDGEAKDRFAKKVQRWICELKEISYDYCLSQLKSQDQSGQSKLLAYMHKAHTELKLKTPFDPKSLEPLWKELASSESVDSGACDLGESIHADTMVALKQNYLDLNVESVYELLERMDESIKQNPALIVDYLVDLRCAWFSDGTDARAQRHVKVWYHLIEMYAERVISGLVTDLDWATMREKIVGDDDLQVEDAIPIPHGL